MGTIYPKPAWPEVVYDNWYEQVDPDDTKQLQFMGIRTWLVMWGRKRTMVQAKTLQEAKEKACAKRGLRMGDVTLVQQVYRKDVIKNVR